MTRIALLGGGFMARTHAQSYGALKDRAEVRVVCALEGADAIAADLGAAAASDWEAVIGRDDVDAVLSIDEIATTLPALATGGTVGDSPRRAAVP